MILNKILYSKSCIFCYMKNMRRFIKYSLVLVVIIIFAITLYPMLLNRYGERLIIIRQLLNMLILMALFIYVNRSIEKFSLGIYKYYKLLGVKEIDILARYIKNNAYRYFLCFCLLFASVYAGKLLSALLCTAQVIMYCNCLILVLYVLMHKHKCKITLFWILVITCVSYVIYILCQLPGWMGNNADVNKLLLLFNNSTLMNMHRVIFFECHIYNIAVVAILTALSIRQICSSDDNSVIEAISNSKRTLPDTYFNKVISKKRYGVLRDVKIAFRNKENLLSYGLLFGLYVFCCCLFGYVPQLLFGVSFLCIVLVNYGLEGVYLNDILTFPMYKLCGEDFGGFIRNKIKVSAIINFVFCSVYTIKCIDISCVKEWILLLLLQIISIWYWNTYYSYLYSGMKLTRTLVYELKRMIVLVIGLIPVVNILFAIMYYKKGKRRWNYYVNNGQSDKKI